MKISSLLLGCSLLANGVLAVVLLFGVRSQMAGHSVASSATRTTATTAGRAADGSIAGSPAGPGTEAWSRLQNDDIAAYRAQLEAEGFSPRLARALAAEEIRRQFAPRRAALNLKANERPFWEQAIQDPQTTEELRQISKEQAQAIRDLLGPDPNDFATTALREQLSGFSGDKIAGIIRIQQAFADKRSDLYASTAGVAMSALDMEKRDALTREQHAEIAKLLTPEELEAYDLRTSDLASQLRSQFSAFDATEDEFLAVYRLQGAYADRLPRLSGVLTAEESQARAATQKELEEQIHAALGDDRFEQYQRSKDYNYQITNRLVGRLDLPRSATDEVWAVQKDIQQRVTALRSDPTLTPAARTQQLTTLADEAKTRVTATLGDRGFEAYKQYGGSWLRALQPPPSPPRAAP